MTSLVAGHMKSNKNKRQFDFLIATGDDSLLGGIYFI